VPELRSGATKEFPFILNTGRVRDQWHTMTRTGLSPRLALHAPEPFVDVHPEDARALGLKDFARVTTQHGTGVYRVVLSTSQQRGALFAPIHWSGETASAASTCELVAAATDPYSGQPEAKATPVAIAPVDFPYRAFVLARQRVEFPKGTWWARVALNGGTGYLLAFGEGPKFWREHAQTMMSGGEFAEFIDIPRGIYRAASFHDGRLKSVLFVGPAGTAPQWDTAKTLFEAPELGAMQRRILLSGRPVDGLADSGPVICACFGVGLNVIREAIESDSAISVEAIGKAVRAGTNCGSCLPELKRIVHEHAHAN
jgi:assimilatory nitrate reductase catalytic subunit